MKINVVDIIKKGRKELKEEEEESEAATTKMKMEYFWLLS